jgi:P27 family predicted phage terminase small subunit
MALRKPAKVLELNGRGPGRDSAGRPVPVAPRFRREAPKPPSWLSRKAKAEWRRVAPVLERHDLFKPEDRAGFTVYCETWANWCDARRDIVKNGLHVQNHSTRKDGTESIWWTKNPSVAICQAASVELRHWCAKFGLTPADERLVSRTDDLDVNGDNPFASPPPWKRRDYDDE